MLITGLHVLNYNNTFYLNWWLQSPFSLSSGTESQQHLLVELHVLNTGGISAVADI